MERSLESGQPREIMNQAHDETVSEIQDKIALRLVEGVEEISKQGHKTAILTETIEPQDINDTKEAMIIARNFLECAGHSARVDFSQRQSNHGESEQSLSLVVDLQPEPGPEDLDVPITDL